MKHGKLHVLGFGVACGIVWALSLFITAILAQMNGYGSGFISGLSSVYVGYAPTLMGAVMGAIWGFFDMLIAGIILAVIYNIFIKVKPTDIGE